MCENGFHECGKGAGIRGRWGLIGLVLAIGAVIGDAIWVRWMSQLVGSHGYIPLLQWGTVQSRDFYWAAGLNGLAHYWFGISVGCELQGNCLINAAIDEGHGQTAPVEWVGTVRRLCHYVAAMVHMDLAGCGRSLNMVSLVGAGSGLTRCVLEQVLIFSNTVNS